MILIFKGDFGEMANQQQVAKKTLFNQEKRLQYKAKRTAIIL